MEAVHHRLETSELVRLWSRPVFWPTSMSKMTDSFAHLPVMQQKIATGFLATQLAKTANNNPVEVMLCVWHD